MQFGERYSDGISNTAETHTHTSILQVLPCQSKSLLTESVIYISDEAQTFWRKRNELGLQKIGVIHTQNTAAYGEMQTEHTGC